MTTPDARKGSDRSIFRAGGLAAEPRAGRAVSFTYHGFIQEEVCEAMNWDQVEGNWKQF